VSGLLPARADRGDVEELFLVELLHPGVQAAGALRMAGALQHAAARLSATGTHLAWRGGLLVPAQSRCLCLLEASSEDAVRHAGDVAGLATATVHRVTPLLMHTTAPVLPGPAPSGRLAEGTAAPDGAGGSG